jgi:hypothetical protein
MESMKFRRPTPRLRRAVAVAAAVTLATTAAATLTASPASAITGALTNVSLTVNNNAANTSSGVTLNTATYTWAFTTAQSGTLSQIQFTVPATTTLPSPAPGHVVLYGLVNCTVPATGSPLSIAAGADPATDDSTVTLTLDCTAAVGENIPAVVTIPGFTNPTTTQSTFATTVTTFTGSTSPSALDTGKVGDASNTASPTVDFNDNTTSVSVFVPQSLTFINDTDHASISLAPVPDGPVFEAQPVTLTVKTNLVKGYQLAGCIQGGLLNGTIQLPQVGDGAPAAAVAEGSSGFGAEATVTTGSVHGTLDTSGVFTAASYTGYSTDCSTSTTLITHDDGPASDDSIAITNAASASATQASGTYSGTITYVVTPKYN